MPNYVPLLRMKRGELSALEALQSATKLRVTPYLDVSADRFRGKDATKTKPAQSPPETIAQSIKKSWGNTPIFVDASKVSPSSASPNPILEIISAAAGSGLHVIPATQLSASPGYTADVLNAHSTYGHGVCLKIDLQEMTSASTWAPAFPIPPSDVDLIIDFGSNVANVASLGTSLTAAFHSLHKALNWRSVTMAGSSMPENFSGYTKGTYLIDRIEFQLWKNLQSAGLSYDLGYGDYATVAVTAPATGIAWGFPINVRYTLEEEFLVCRGVKTTGPGAVDLDAQLVSHAKDIAAHSKRTAVKGCWADQKIDQIVKTGTGQGNLETWVKIGVNRHVELTNFLLP